MSTIKVNDLTVYYESAGSGPPLILLPGLLGTIESDWRRFIPTLAAEYRTIAVDLRGHGRTDNPAVGGDGPGELDIRRMADDLIGLIDGLGLNQPAVLGYSLGGCVGLMAGLKQPGCISALVMHATKFFWSVESIQAMTAGFDPAGLREKSPRYVQNLQQNHGAVYGEGYWQDLLERAARFVRTMPNTVPGLEKAAEAAFPILVSVGDHDQLINLEEAVRLYRALPRGELLVMPDTRHPIKSVRVESFWPVVKGFLTQETAA